MGQLICGPMEADGRHVAWLRAQISGDEARMRQIADELSRLGDLDPLPWLIHCTFVLAVRKAFGERFTSGEVVRLAADARSMLAPSGMIGVIDPVAAESEIRRALGDPAPEFPDPDARAAAQITVLDYLVHHMALDDGQISELLRQARQMTERAAEA